MAWLKIYQSIREHRKILDAADDLEIEPPHMIGLLTSFWLWALDNAPDGDVSNISARNIARASQWKGDADKLLEALISAGLLDRRDSETEQSTILIHDWEEYAGGLIQEREKEREFYGIYFNEYHTQKNAQSSELKELPNYLEEKTSFDRKA